MSYINRHMEQRITELSKTWSAILLTGPRQSGKTTMLKKTAAAEEKRAEETSVLMQFRFLPHSSDVIFETAVEIPDEEMLHTSIYMGIIS